MNETTSSVDESWNAFLNVRTEFAGELSQIAAELPSDRRKQVLSIAKWLKSNPQLKEALENPDALAVCMPALQMARSGRFEKSEIGHAARLGFCSVGRSVSAGRRLVALLLYPIFVLLAALSIWAGFSFWVSPQFENMYREFGIELPKLTVLVLRSSEFLRQWWWIFGLLLLAVAVLAFLATRAGSGLGNSGQSWLDQKLMSTRNALASWAWHISLLLELGVEQGKAFEAAGRATGNLRLRESSMHWANLERDPARQEAQLVETGQFFMSSEYQLLNRTLQLDSPSGKISMLRETAIYYWDRCRNVGEWWVYWLVACMLWAMGSAILIGLISLFMPMIQLISGLTA